MSKPKQTPMEAALKAYVRTAAAQAWTNAQFVEQVQKDFNVGHEAANGFLMAVSFCRPETWRPKQGA